MANIAISWELGSGFGHISRLEPIARQLQLQGHNVIFIVKDVGCVSEWLGSNQFQYIPAPISLKYPCLKRPPANYAEILIAEGYGSKSLTLALISAWLNILSVCKSDLVLADHAPLALMSSRILGIPCVQVGSGFELPPQLQPMPCFRPWENIHLASLQASENQMLGVLNDIASTHCAEKLDVLSDLFDIEWSAITSFSELDHYGERAECLYIGPIISSKPSLKIEWASAGHRIFIYYHSVTPELLHMLQFLEEFGAEVICVVPEARSLLSRFSGGFIRVYSKLVDVDSLLSGMTAAITHGGVGMANKLLLSGVPALMVPNNIEQYMHSKRIAELGAGLVLGNNRGVEEVKKSIYSLLYQESFSSRAKEFQKRYFNYKSSSAVSKVVHVVNAITSVATIHISADFPPYSKSL